MTNVDIVKTFYKPVILIDTNIIIDLLANREPYSHAAAMLFDMIEREQVDAYVNSLSIVTIYYILRNHYKVSHQLIIEKFSTLLSLVKITSVDDKHIEQALQSEFTDFEDAVLYFSAISQVPLTHIVTRNKKDFSITDLSVLTAEEFCKN